MNRARWFRAYAVETKYESLRMLRTPAFAGPFLLMPVALYLLFGVLLFGAELAKDSSSALFTFLGFTVMGVMGPGMFGFGIAVATEREHGLLRLKRALPTPPGAVLLARMLMAMLFVAIIMASMAAAAPYGHLRLGAGRMLALSLVSILGALPFCGLGFAVGVVTSAKSAPAFVNLLYLPMIYLSGILFPMPQSARWLTRISPAWHLAQTARAAIGAANAGAVWIHVAVLAAVTIVCTWWAHERLARHSA